ncbi:MAG: polyprenyl diphosphate synthase [Planctomycetota bacterium]|jgi:undecaprenyl diphosphate synthase
MSAAQADVSLDPGSVPRHVAVIMDGNGRWARRRGWLRPRGHQRGADVVHTVTTESARLGVEWLTLYAFSSENWSRPALEVAALMELLERYLEQELPTLLDNDIRFEVVGRIERLPQRVRELSERNRQLPAAASGMTLCLALSYGGRDELVDACRAVASRVAAGTLEPTAIDEATIAAELYAPQAPEVDVVVRSAGEQRLSNFLLWQAAYAEFVTIDALWPDVTAADYRAALCEFAQRERRFGAV